MSNFFRGGGAHSISSFAGKATLCGKVSRMLKKLVTKKLYVNYDDHFLCYIDKVTVCILPNTKISLRNTLCYNKPDKAKPVCGNLMATSDKQQVEQLPCLQLQITSISNQITGRHTLHYSTIPNPPRYPEKYTNIVCHLHCMAFGSKNNLTS